MATFNLKKMSKTVKPYEKMLEDNNKATDLKPVENTGNLAWNLSKLHKEPKGDQSYEKLLVDTHKEASNTIIEKQLNDAKGGYQKKREVTDNLVTEMAKSSEETRAKDFKKANDATDRDTSFWDDYVGVQMDEADITRIVANDQPSQLVENYKDREDFKKGTKETKKTAQVEQFLSDADAMLFNIYRNAQGRDLSEIERKQVNDINSEKIRTLISTESK